MKKSILKISAICLLVFTSTLIKAQALAGSYTIGVSYPDIATAITALNTNSISASTTIQIPSGYTETAPVGGYTLTCSGTAAAPIVFMKTGSGVNPLISAYSGGTGTPGTTVQDGVWRFIGTDYITINGIDLVDPNPANPATMEFGYGFFKASVTDGCQNNTVKNCTITLNRINNATGNTTAVDGSRGIEFVNALTGAHPTPLVPTMPSGSNSNNMIYSNTIQNCNFGIALIGYAAPSPFSLADSFNDIGGSSSATGNTIINYGGGGVTNPAAAIRTLAQYNLNISYNIINNNNGSGVNHATTLRGIYMNTATSANASVLNNTITVNSNATTSQLTAIENVAGSTAASNTINISGNLITNCTYSTTTSGVFTGIFNNSATPAYLKIENNTFSGLTLNSASSTGSVGLIMVGGTIANGLSISSNTIQNIGPLNTTGSVVCINNNNSTNNYTVQNNYVNNVARGSVPTLGGMNGYYNNSSPTGGTAYVINNTFMNLTGGIGSTAVHGINFTPTTSQTCIVTGNTITAVSSGSTTSNGILHSYGAAGSVLGNNSISNFSVTGGVNGINITSTSAPLGLTISNNRINGLITTGAFSAVGINYSAGVNTFIQKNKIYDITSNNATGTAYGINIGATGGGNMLTVINNYIGDIKAPSTSNPANAVVGINIPATSTTAQIHIYYNTIYLTATSSGANFGTTGLLHTTSTTSTTAQLFLRNNIIINNSTPNGTGIVASYRRSTATLTNYNSASNNNNFYVTAGPSNYVYYDGTNMFTTLGAYQAFVTPRDANSISENTPFLSTSGPSVNYLHVDPAMSSLTESGAVNIAGITDDYDNDIRQGNPGYAGSGIAPDIGADEYNQILASCSTVSLSTVSPSSLFRCAGQTAVLTATGVTTGSGIVYQWQVSNSPTGPFSNVSGGSGANTTIYTTGTLSAGTYYYMLLTTCTISAATATSNVSSMTVNPVPSASLTTNSPLCSGSTLNLMGGTDIGTTFVWSGPAGFTSSLQNPSITNVTASVSGVYNLTISAAGCTASPVSASVTINSTPSSLTISPMSGSVCAGSSFTLNASGGDIDKTMQFGTQANQNTATTGSAGYPAPYSAYYGGQRMQMLILASELSAAGFTANSPIMSVQFPVVSRGANWGSTINDLKFFQVNMGATSLSSLTSFQSGLTNVVAPGSFTPAVGYNNAHLFATPFIWDGTSNVILETTWSNNISGVAADLVTQYNSPTTFSSTVVYRADNVTAAAAAAAATPNFTYMARPDFKLNGMGPGTFLWSPASSLSSASTLTTVASPTTTTSYTLVAINGTCSSQANTTVSVTPLPSVNVSATPSVVCDGDPATLIASGATTYSWSTSSNSSSITVTPSVNTTYTVDGSNACGTDTKTISVTVNANPTVSAVSSSTAVCTGNSATLTASGANTYSWTSVGPGTSIVVNPTSGTTYTVEGTDANGCKNMTTINLGVNPNPTVTAMSSPTAVCAGNSATLTASGATTYSWTSVGAGASVVVTPSMATTYTVEGTDANGCMDIVSISLNVNSNPVITAMSSPTVVCSGNSTTLTASGANTYSWTGVGAGASVVVTPSTAATYTVEGTDANGCRDIITVNVNVNANPNLSAITSATILCAGDSATLTVSGANTYSWTGVGPGASIVVNPTVTTTYTVEGVDGNGCMDTLSITQVVSLCTGVQGILANSNGIMIYPNPSNGMINLVVTDISHPVKLEIYDAVGRVIYGREINTHQTQIDLSELSDGIYAFRVMSDLNVVKQGKLIKE
jgi:hypothetical protein